MGMIIPFIYGKIKVMLHVPNHQPDITILNDSGPMPMESPLHSSPPILRHQLPLLLLRKMHPVSARSGAAGQHRNARGDGIHRDGAVQRMEPEPTQSLSEVVDSWWLRKNPSEKYESQLG